MPTVRYTTINGEIVAEKRNNVRSLYVPDPLGSTVALLDNTQTQTDQWSYMPYGESSRIKGSNPTPFLFVGTKGYRNDNSIRTYVRARVLEPPKGRWMTEDPVGLSIQGFDLFVYAGGSPVRNLDRSGLTVVQIPPHSDPDIQRPPDGRGVTYCSYDTGRPFSEIEGSWCFAVCIEVHEAQHRYDYKQCCARAARCIKRHKASRAECDRAFSHWVAVNESALECQANKNTLQCLEDMMRNRGCANKPTDKTCNELRNLIRKEVIPRIGRFCGGKTWPRASLTPCPIGPDGSIVR